MKVFNSPPTADELQALLKEAERERDEISTRLKPVAYAYYHDQPGSSAEMDTLEHDLKENAKRIRQLTAAISVAVEMDAVKRRKRDAEKYAEQVRTVKGHLKERDKHAESLSRAIETACNHYRLLVEHSFKAKEASPTAWPSGTLCELQAIKKAV